MARRPQGGTRRIEEAYSQGYARGHEVGRFGGPDPDVPWRFDVQHTEIINSRPQTKGMGTAETRRAYLQGYRSGTKDATRRYK